MKDMNKKIEEGLTNLGLGHVRLSCGEHKGLLSFIPLDGHLAKDFCENIKHREYGANTKIDYGELVWEIEFSPEKHRKHKKFHEQVIGFLQDYIAEHS